jgi:ubiquinone/menaquinone biosynthesis C-methylase UbiE
MTFYSRKIFPWLMDWAMDRELLNRIRREVLSEARGDVLEIGFGTGVNLPFYPSAVRKLTTADPNPGMTAYAQQRIQASSVCVETKVLSAEALALPDRAFDTVVSTMTMCSIPDVARATAEVCRVLRPGGRFLFFEHGQSPDPKVRIWQDRFTPISKVLGNGCHLNRNIRTFLEAQPFVLESLKNFYLEGTPKAAGYIYQGIAQKPL